MLKSVLKCIKFIRIKKKFKKFQNFSANLVGGGGGPAELVKSQLKKKKKKKKKKKNPLGKCSSEVWAADRFVTI